MGACPLTAQHTDCHEVQLTLFVLACCSNLASAGLTGSLPLDNSVWEPLASLQSLNLADNSIRGYVPPQFADLTNLQSVQLQNNQLQGPLPNLSTSTSLQSANVAGNQLTGEGLLGRSRTLSKKIDLQQHNMNICDWQHSTLQSINTAGNQFTGNRSAGSGSRRPV